MIAGLFLLLSYSQAMKRILAIAALALLSACATITADKEQVIDVATTPAGANCMISNSKQKHIIEQTPGSVTVERMFEPLTVTCDLQGVGSAATTIEAKTRGRAYGNLLMLGVPAVVDAGTGAGYEYDPASVSLSLKP